MEYPKPSMREEYDTSALNKSKSMDTDHPNRSLEKNIGQSTTLLPSYTFMISLLISFTLGSVLILTVTLFWHSDLVMKEIPSVLEDCPFVKLASTLSRRRRRIGGLMVL